MVWDTDMMDVEGLYAYICTLPIGEQPNMFWERWGRGISRLLKDGE